MTSGGPLIVLLSLFFLIHANVAQDSSTVNSERIQLFDNVYVKVPEDRNGVSFEITPSSDGVSGRGKTKKLMQKFMPMFIMPFVIQSTIIPLFLGMIKFLLFKSLMIGKLALVLIIMNAFRNHNSFKGRNDAEIANVHYGYHGNGMEEYGSYFN